jgi:hypothetical protein
MKDYAQNPYAYAKKVIQKAMDGTYEHYFPAGGAPTPPPTTTSNAPGASQGRSGVE